MDAREVIQRIVEDEEDFEVEWDKIVFKSGDEYEIKSLKEAKSFSEFMLTILFTEDALTRENILGISNLKNLPDGIKLLIFFYPYSLERKGDTIKIDKLDDTLLKTLTNALNREFFDDKRKKGLKAIVEAVENQGFEVEIGFNTKNKFKPV